MQCTRGIPKKILEGLPGVVCLSDDILMFGKDQEEHNSRLAAVLKQLAIEGNNVTLSSDKFEFSKARLLGLWAISSIQKVSVLIDPAKTSATSQMLAPQSLTELRRFMAWYTNY